MKQHGTGREWCVGSENNTVNIANVCGKEEWKSSAKIELPITDVSDYVMC